MLFRSPAEGREGRYDYNRLSSYGHMARDLVSKDSTIKDKLHALDQIAMLGLVTFVLYPALGDTLAQTLTGNKNATMTRFGASTIPEFLHHVWKGDESPMSTLGHLFHVSPMINLLGELGANKDLRTGGTFAHNPAEATQKIAGQLAPVNMMMQEQQGKQSVSQLLWAALGVKSPTDEQVEKKKAFVARQKAELERFKKKVEGKKK